MTKHARSDASQSARFVKAARELGCDDDPEAFKDKLKQLVKAPPPASVGKRKSKKQDQ